jgi:predicted TIM-barrel fold metal-dependent hydrolase
MSSKTKMRVIDCDTHFWQPFELWEGYVDPKLHKTMKEAWETKTGLHLAAPDIRKRQEEAFKIKGADHVKERLEWMDEEGIDACVIYPSGAGLLAYDEDMVVAAETCLAVNLWSAQFAAGSPDRLYPCMVLPWYDPKLAFEEFERARDLGLRFAFGAPTPSTSHRWSDPVYNPIWAGMENAGIIMTFHEFTRIPGAKSNFVARQVYKDSYPMMYLCGHTVEVQLALMDVVLGGVCHRHPNLAIGFVEAHAAWLQGWLAMLDSVWTRPITSKKRKEENWPGDDTLPSEIFKRQCFIVAFPDDNELDLLVEKLGSEVLTLCTDYPHPQTTYGLIKLFDGTYPNFGAKDRRNALGASMDRLIAERTSRNPLTCAAK